MSTSFFQDRMPGNHCFGCGPLNELGLRIKSSWDGDESVCTFQPRPEHSAGPRHVMNGGVTATLIDCHCVCTATAHAYRSEGRAMGSAPEIWCVTKSLEIEYMKPVPIDLPVQLRARVVEVEDRRTRLACSLSSAGLECARGTVLASRVPSSWRARGAAAERSGDGRPGSVEGRSVFSNPAGRTEEQTRSYIEAVLALVGERDPVEILEELTTELRGIVRDMDDAEIRTPEAPGKWSCLELLAHLADSELVWAFRLRTVLADVEPILGGYDQDRWVERLRSSERDPATILEELAIVRRGNLRLVKSLTGEELERCGRSAAGGRETVRHLIRRFAGHDLVHRRQLHRIRAALKAEDAMQDEPTTE